MHDRPRVLPTLVPGDDEDAEVDPFEVFEMSLSTEQRQLIYDNHYSLGEAFDGKVPGIDPDELVANAIDETGCYTGPWTPFP
jgi:hypothetical protein